MSEKRLEAELRTSDFGTRGSRRLLRSGRIPAVVYGQGQPLHVTVDARTFNYNKKGYSGSTIIKLDVKGEKSHDVFVKSYQEDLLRNLIQHIDFYETASDQVVRTRVRVELEGTPAGVKEGGAIEQIVREVEVECLPKDLPKVLTLDVSPLGLNASLKVSDINAGPAVRILSALDVTVATVKPLKGKAAKAAQAAASAESEENK